MIALKLHLADHTLTCDPPVIASRHATVIDRNDGLVKQSTLTTALMIIAARKSLALDLT